MEWDGPTFLEFARARQFSLQSGRRVLTARGVDAKRLAQIGCGAARALWVGGTEEERARNRRAELVRNSERETCIPFSSFAFP